MKRFILPILCMLSAPVFAYQFPANTYYNVCFTPGQNCTKMITSQIGRAKHTLYMQGYSFTSYKIARALVQAYKHGVKVKVILDKSNFNGKNFSQAKYLIKHHVPVWEDSQLRIAHNKVMIFDNETVETGSFNFTYGAQHHNAENAIIIDSKPLASLYYQNWLKRQIASKRVN